MINYSLVNQKTYNRVAEEYAETRKKEWGLWEEIGKYFFASISPRKRVLDLGCGSGRLLDYLKRDFEGKFEYVGVDYAKEMIKVARRRHPDFQFLNLNLHIPGMCKQSFDLVTMIASYHHVFGRGDRIGLLKGIKKILNPGGKLLITVWIINRDFGLKIKRIDFQEKPRYYVLLGKKELEGELSEVFDEVKVRFDKKKQNFIAVAC